MQLKISEKKGTVDTMNDILYSEWMKLKRSKALIIGLSGSYIVPAFVLFNSIQRHLKNPNEIIDLFGLYDSAIMFLMLLFAPLVMAVTATYIISREYSEKTLKTILAVPVSREKFLAGKFCILFLVTVMFMLISWFHILALAILCSLFTKVEQITVMSASFFLIKMLFGAVLLYMSITPVVYLSIRNKGFVAPFIASAAVCLLNVVLSGSRIAGYIPWCASYLLVTGKNRSLNCPPYVSFLILAGVCLLSIAASAKHFLKEDIL